MLIIQYLIILFAAFLIARTIVNFQKRKIDLKQAILWIILWLVLLVIAIMPEVMGIPATLLGIQRSVDVFVYIGIIVLFYICFYLYSKIESHREKITRLARIIAIQQAQTEGLLIGKAEKRISVLKKANKNLLKKRFLRKNLRNLKKLGKKDNFFSFSFSLKWIQISLILMSM